jgi:SAM-dependent methyltransferase
MTRSPSFDRVARIYRWAEYISLGPLLERTRKHYLTQLTACHRALVLGDGDGRFLARLLRQNPSLHAVAVDTSATMLQLLTKRCAFSGSRLETTQTSALVANAPPQTDLIVTHFFLDCLAQQDVDHLTQRISAQLQPGALWLLSDFAVPNNPLLRPLARLYIRSLYLAFRLLAGLRQTRLPDPQISLTQAGFVRIARHQKVYGLLYTELWQRK